MTVSELRKKLKGIDGNIEIYISDHDHGTYETNGKLKDLRILNQKDMSDWDKQNLDEIFKIKGTYVSMRVG